MVIEILFYFFPNPLYPNMSLFQKLTYILHFHSLLHFSVFLFCLLFWYPSSNYFLPFFSVFISVNKSTFSLPLYMWRGVYQPSEKQTKLWLLFSQPAPVGSVLTHPSGNALGQNFLHLPLSQCPKSRISWPSTFSGSVPCTWNTEFGRFLLPLTLCVEAKHILLFLNYSAKSPFFSLYLIIEISRLFFPHIYFKCLFFLFSDIQTVLDSCLVSKLPLFFPIAAAKSMTFWWVFALLCIEKCTSWHGVTGCLQSEKDDTASLCTMVHVWKICGVFFFFFILWERKLKCFKNTLAEGKFRCCWRHQISSSAPGLSILPFSVFLPLTSGMHRIPIQEKDWYQNFQRGSTRAASQTGSVHIERISVTFSYSICYYQISLIMCSLPIHSI